MKKEFETLDPGDYVAELTNIKEHTATWRGEGQQKDYRAKRFIFKVDGRHAWANTSVPDSNSLNSRRLKLISEMAGGLPKEIQFSSYTPPGTDKTYLTPKTPHDEVAIKKLELDLIGRKFTITVGKKGDFTFVEKAVPNSGEDTPANSAIVNTVMSGAGADLIFDDEDIPF